MKNRVLILACLALTVAGCGGGGSDHTAGHSISTKMMSKAEIAKLPALRIPTATGLPPRHVEVVDLRKGSGPPVTKADVVSFRYIEDTYPQARKGTQGGLSGGVIGPLSYPVSDAPFRSLRAGLPGMKVGGRRELIVPPKPAYPRWKPSWGYAPYVSIFVVDLLGVEPPAALRG
jgi:peptidylprolyl isomerase